MQGVDLSNIIKDLALNPNCNHVVSSCIAKLKDVYDNDGDDESILKELDVLTVCNI